jgi:signal transduction histidine kinase/ligand-binding sensor domain-containing protein
MLLRHPIAVLSFACVLAAPAHALDGRIPLAAYHHDIWTAKNGAPAEVSALAQGRDGWLWVGSADGLYRFDGVRFRRLEARAGDAAPLPLVTALTALRDGSLLIGHMRGGVQRLQGGRLLGYPATGPDGKPLGAVYSTHVDADGRLWAATTRGLLRLEEGHWADAGKALGLGGGKASNLTVDQYGQVWVAEGRRLWVLRRDAVRFAAVLDDVDAVNLLASPDGRLWLDTHERMVPVPPQHAGIALPRPDWMAQAGSQENGLFDRDGNFWSLACPVGVCRIAGVAARPSAPMWPNAEPRERLDQPWQLSSLTANALFEDRDGNLWIGTQNGLERFRHNRVQPVVLQGGERVFSLSHAADGAVLALATPTGILWQLTRDGAIPAAQGTGPGLFGPKSFVTGPFGTLVDGAAAGTQVAALADVIERRSAAGVERIPYPAALVNGGVITPAQQVIDDGVALWAGTSRGGLFRHGLDGWRSAESLGIPNPVYSAARGAPGEIWFGHDAGAITRYRAGGAIMRYAPADGSGLGTITFLHAQGDVIAAGHTGMAVLKDGRFRRLASDDPETLMSVSGMAVASNGDRYFNGKRGVVRVTAAAWREALAQPDRPLRGTLMGALDGYPGTASTLGRRGTAIAGTDGQLWFAASGGLARIDTTRAEPVPLPPQVKIETLVARQVRHVDCEKKVTLAPGTSSFRIEYTALSYRTPETVRFRYRLDGVDSGWQEVATRRAVSYTNVGPGTYRFHVEAEDELGQKNAAPAAIDITIEPTFMQTPLFLGLCALLAGAAIYLLHRLRLRQATARVAERLGERERIARALHDSFLQSVQGLILTFHAAAAGLTAGSAAREKLERAIVLAERVIDEGRDEVQRLRSPDGPEGDLASALASVGAVLQEAHGIPFQLHGEGTTLALQGDANCEAYHVGREALINAFRHAGATQVTVTLDFSAERFLLRVADNGSGLPPEIAARGGRGGHWGIPGMHERAKRAGGTLRIVDGAAGGTLVELTIPGRAAYARRFPLLGRRTGAAAGVTG